MAPLGRPDYQHGGLAILSRAMIFGINGQDGSYLAELLLEKNFEVIGWIPDNIKIDLDNIRGIKDQIILIDGNLSDQDSINRYIEKFKPDHIYNLASPSSPYASWNSILGVADIAALGAARILEAIRVFNPHARYYQASSSELFGDPLQVPQNEETPFHPRNPYGISKLYAHWLTVRYRQQFGIYTVSGILFNHESPRRSIEFVTRKITSSAAKIKLGIENKIKLGDLQARRDWGFAADYTKAMYLMMTQDNPQDFVIGTGQTHSVEEFCALAFRFLDLDYHEFLVQDQEFIRPPEAKQLVADASKASKLLGWHPEVSFEELVNIMVKSDLGKLLKK